MSARVPLKAVAAAAQVSVATASLALSGDHRVAPATREKVERAARSLGYVRDPVLSSLAGGRFRHTGKPIVIAVSTGQVGWNTPFQQRALEMGMTLHQLPADIADPGAEAKAMGAAAVVLNRRGMDAAAIAALPLPAVLWEDESPDEPVVDLIETHEWWAGTTGAINRMRAAGFKRTGVVLTPAEPRHWHDDVRLAAARSMGALVLETRHDDGDLKRFIAAKKPDAILGGISWAYSAMQRIGVQLPFASMIVLEGPWFDAMAGWVTDQDSRARMTLELIEQRLRYGPRPPRRIIIPPHWRDGGTLRR